MKHPSLKFKILIRKVTVSLGQFKWGTCLNLWGHLEAILNADPVRNFTNKSITGNLGIKNF